VLEIFNETGKAVARVRRDRRPQALILHTYRFCHHSKNDDDRDPCEVEQWRASDPIKLLGERVDAAVFRRLESAAVERVRTAEQQVRAEFFPTLEGKSLDDVMEL
jgi:TPP-dependent pyruvate/acetoin dehydrogenase alpha subunit